MPTPADGRTGALRLLLPMFVLVSVGLWLAPLGTAADSATPPPSPSFAGSDTCTACHSQVTEAQRRTWHSSQIMRRPDARNCEDCHGPSATHAEDPMSTRTNLNLGRASAANGARACYNCHETSRNNQTLWRTAAHARASVRCWDCHSRGGSPHSLLVRKPDEQVCYSCHPEQRATFELNSHHPVREGRVDCQDCHNPHARQTARDWVKVCGSCHLEQRGPWIFEHGSLSGELGEGCVDCHRPHGSPNGRLLKLTGRGLCLQCHADHALHFVGRTCWTSGCHSRIHGSNASPLLLGP